MIRTAEWVRGYFDGEGCVHFSNKPSKHGRNATLVVETTDFDLMNDLQETLASWNRHSTLKTRPPGPRANLPKARINIKSRATMERFFEQTRPLSAKHERRLAPLLLHWTNVDRFHAAIEEAKGYLAGGLTRREAAARAGITVQQLDNRRDYEKRRFPRSKLAGVPWAVSSDAS